MAKSFNKITLSPSDLLDKYGFSDGDDIYDSLKFWVYNHPLFSKEVLPYERHDLDTYGVYSAYFSSTKLLTKIVYEEIIKKYFSKDEEKYFNRFVTSHNPIRLMEIDIATSHEDNNKIKELEERIKHLPPVIVDFEMLNKYASELFPFKTRAYASFFEVMSFDVGLIHNLLELYKDSSLVKDYSFELSDYMRIYLDEFSQGKSDDELVLARDIFLGTRQHLTKIFESVDLLLKK